MSGLGLFQPRLSPSGGLRKPRLPDVHAGVIVCLHRRSVHTLVTEMWDEFAPPLRTERLGSAGDANGQSDALLLSRVSVAREAEGSGLHHLHRYC